MTLSSEFVARKNCSEGRQYEDDDEGVGDGYGKATKTISKDSGSRRFRASIIGLPKRPDTKFRKADYSGRIRSSISRKCRRSTVPLFSGLPREAMANSKGCNNSFKIYDPGSPDVSCLGRIKLKQKDGVKLNAIASASSRRLSATDAGSSKRQGRFSWIKKLFSFSGRRRFRGSKPTAGCDESCSRNYQGHAEEEEEQEECHTLQLKRLASQREPDALSNFSADDDDFWKEASSEEDEENQGFQQNGKGLDVVREGPFSSPQFVGEINLWKRRSVTPPRVLKLSNRSAFDMRRPVTV